MVKAAVDQVTDVGNGRDVRVDHRVLGAVHRDGEGAEGQLVARRDRGELVLVGGERVAKPGRRVYPQVRPCGERVADGRLIHVVKVLVGDEDGVSAADDFRRAR